MPKPVHADGTPLPPENQDGPPDIPTVKGAGPDDSELSPLHFPPAEPFESEDEADIPSATVAASKPHHTDRGTVAAITTARKMKYYGKKKESNSVYKTKVIWKPCTQEICLFLQEQQWPMV